MSSRRPSSAQWLRDHENDPYVLAARKSGYRSRAAYKLLEIQQRQTIIRSGQTVIDLGAAPGGWSQVAARLVGSHGLVLAMDLLPMEPILEAPFIPGLRDQGIAPVHFLPGDFTAPGMEDLLNRQLPQGRADVVLSDMAPNTSGIKSLDQMRGEYLAEVVLAFAATVLQPNGVLLVKLFQGSGLEAVLKLYRSVLQSVKPIKPPASRDQSPELYLLGRGLRSSARELSLENKDSP